MKKPEICGTLESSKNSVYKSNKEDINTINTIESAIINVENKNNIEKIENIIIEFQKQWNRHPTTEEIIDELDNSVTEEMIQQTKQKISENDNNV